MRWANRLGVGLLFLSYFATAATSQSNPTSPLWICDDCPDEISPVCVNGITFRHRCLAECQGHRLGTDGACTGDDLLPLAPWASTAAPASAPPAASTAALASSKSSTSPPPPPRSPKLRKPRASDMKRFESDGFVYVGSVELHSGPSGGGDPSNLGGRMRASVGGAGSGSMAEAAGAVGASSLDNLQVRGMRYSPDTGDFFLEATPRPIRQHRVIKRALMAGLGLSAVVHGGGAVGWTDGSSGASGSHDSGGPAVGATGLLSGVRREDDASRGGGGSGGGSRRVLGDNRWGVLDAKVYPFSALAHFIFSDPSATAKFQCSGAFITPWDVLTAAHCVWSFSTGTGYKDWRISPALDKKPNYDSPATYISADYATFYRTETTNRSYADQRGAVNYFDIAVIRVMSPHTAWLGIKYDCARASYPKTMACGYTDPIYNPQCNQCFLTTSQCRPMWMMYNYCYSRRGQSGSSIVDLDDLRVLGVLSGGPPNDWDYSYWTPIDAFHFSNIVRWMWKPPPPPSAFRSPSPLPTTASPAVRQSQPSSSSPSRQSPPPPPPRVSLSPPPPPPPPLVRMPPPRPRFPPPLVIRTAASLPQVLSRNAGLPETSQDSTSDLDANPPELVPVLATALSPPPPTTARSSVLSTVLLSAAQAAAASVPTPASSGCTNGQLRLMDGPNAWSGRLEICRNNVWGTICDMGWGWDDARVACRQLGFPAGGEAVEGGWFPNATESSPIHYSNVTCLGYETALASCLLPNRSTSCNHKYDAGVICANPAVASPPPSSGFTNGSNSWQPGSYPCSQDGVLRLVPKDGMILHSNRPVTSNSFIIGRVEVCSGGQWGSVCDDNWNNNDALVVCKQFRFPSGRALTRAITSVTATPAAPPPPDSNMLDLWTPGPLNMSIWLSNVDCTGAESSLLACRRRTIASGFRLPCTHQEDAGVVCFNTPAPVAPPQPPPPECSEDGALRLVPIAGRQGAGRLEVCYSGRYGLVCDNGFGMPEARVACRQLGYLYGRPMGPSNSAVAGDPGPGAFFWMSDVDCVMPYTYNGGWLLRLTQCMFLGWGGSTCNPRRQAVGLVCSNDPSTVAPSPRPPPSPYLCSTPGTVRLAGGSSTSGRLEVCSNAGLWGTVCDSGWSDVDASVACRQLGFARGVAAAPNSFPSGAADQLVLLSDVACTGSETLLSSCNSRNASAIQGCNRHERDAGVVCSNSQPPSPQQRLRPNITCNVEGAVRVVATSGVIYTSVPAVGRVDVCYNNEWGALCNLYDDPDIGWDSISATVVCRQLNGGSDSGVAVLALNNADGGVPPLPSYMRFWKYGILCTPEDDGTPVEARVADCPGSGWGKVLDSCKASNVAGVSCKL